MVMMCVVNLKPMIRTIDIHDSEKIYQVQIEVDEDQHSIITIEHKEDLFYSDAGICDLSCEVMNRIEDKVGDEVMANYEAWEEEHKLEYIMSMNDRV